MDLNGKREIMRWFTSTGAVRSAATTVTAPTPLAAPAQAAPRNAGTAPGTERMAKSRTIKVGAAVAAVASVAGMVFAAAPATATVADYPTSTFSIVYGASYYKGTATFYNRSVGVDGAFKASNCRRIYARAFAGSTSLDFVSSSTWCNRSGPASLPLDANVVGGADNIWVYMTDENQTYLAGQTCYRGVSACVNGLH
ncbi:hypothetical protein [Amycolatopsis sp. NPDC051128]|uniref:hypothetical protein n=1 Tax=Amycolatopsis sp. NPDC051128 TaxID=3155412 RepID=UPI0034196E16